MSSTEGERRGNGHWKYEKLETSVVTSEPSRLRTETTKEWTIDRY